MPKDRGTLEQIYYVITENFLDNPFPQQAQNMATQ